MKLQRIKLDRLVVNQRNDRHGELENETAAIAWLFNTRETHMKNLAKDIVLQGTVYEPPLVSLINGSYVVFDGNRRLTCIKLLEQPKRAPNMQLQEYFQKLRKDWNGDFPKDILCQVEEDRDRIDSILYRRHTGTQNGVGQSTWDDRMKSTFVSRTGKEVGFNVADEVEAKLAEVGLLPKAGQIPRSNLNRLLSAEPFRNRVGFSVRKRKFVFTHSAEKVLGALARIARDLASGEIVLGDIWDVDGKQAYLNRLDSEGLLPSFEDVIGKADKSKPSPAKPKGKADSPKPSPSPKPKPSSRATLIPQKEFGIIWSGRLQRHQAIWEELQFHLELAKHPNAISVLFRVLLELSVENYVSVHSANVHDNDKLALRVKKVGQDLFQKGKINKKQREATIKFGQIDKIVSADTLNRYVHSSEFAPSGKHLEALWDTMAEFIVRCLQA